MKKAIVEKVIDNYIYVVFEDRTYKKYINTGFDIKENNLVFIENDTIVKVEKVDNKLYEEIKKVENVIFK